MKTFKKWALRLLAIILVLILALFLYIQFAPFKQYEVHAPDIKVEMDSASIAEGHRISQILCEQCHLSKNNILEGAIMEDDNAFGTIYSANITQHPEYGIGRYTDGELMYLLRTGINRDGVYLPPWMMKLPHLSDDDMEDIIAYLRSDDPKVQPSDNALPKAKYGLLSKALIKLGAFGPLPYPKETIYAPDPMNEVVYGKYLAVAKFDCYSCHSEDFTTINLMEPEKTPGFFGGGNKFEMPDGSLLLSSNLTKDQETGIGHYSQAQFVKTLQTGIKPDNTILRPPMRRYAMITDQEAKAIYQYLQTIPEIKNETLLANN